MKANDPPDVYENEKFTGRSIQKSSDNQFGYKIIYAEIELSKGTKC